MESKRKIADATARKLAGDAQALTGARVGPNTILKVLSGRRPYRGAFAARFACERAGFYVPLLRDDEDER